MNRQSAERPDIANGRSLDDWVRHIVGIHFHPEHGSPFWVRREAELGIDARRDIRSYEDLKLLGFMPQEALRTGNVLDFLPAAVARDRGRLRVHETGGTSGPPARVAVGSFYDHVGRFMDWYLDEVVGFPRAANWLFIGPTGPHGVADSTRQTAQSRGGMCYFIDLDPRFVKLLFQRQDMQTIALYMEHVRQQAYSILDTQQIDVLGSTPVLLQMLASDLVARGYRFSGMMYGGTQLGRDLFHLLRNEFFPDAVHTAVYGNTLMGGAFLAPAKPEVSDIVYYPIEPMVKLDLIDPNALDRDVALGETGQVCLTVLSEERFLPRVLERDQAERWGVLPSLGWEGVANVRPLETPAAAGMTGVY